MSQGWRLWGGIVCPPQFLPSLERDDMHEYYQASDRFLRGLAIVILLLILVLALCSCRMSGVGTVGATSELYYPVKPGPEQWDDPYRSRAASSDVATTSSTRPGIPIPGE